MITASEVGKNFKDTLKANLKECNINTSIWEA